MSQEKISIDAVIIRSIGVLIALFFLFSSPIVFAAPTPCPDVYTFEGPYSDCTNLCKAKGYTGGGSGSCGSITGACACSASTGGAGGSRAVTPGAATLVPNMGDNIPTFDNPLPQGPDIRIIAGDIIRTVLGIIGSIALVIFLYGGLQWMTSFGDENKITKGRETMIWAGMGLIIIFGSYVFVQFLLTTVLGS